jgi:hypothetical protein
MGSDGIKSGLFYSFDVVLSYNRALKNMPTFKKLYTCESDFLFSVCNKGRPAHKADNLFAICEPVV